MIQYWIGRAGQDFPLRPAEAVALAPAPHEKLGACLVTPAEGCIAHPTHVKTESSLHHEGGRQYHSPSATSERCREHRRRKLMRPSHRVSLHAFRQCGVGDSLGLAQNSGYLPVCSLSGSTGRPRTPGCHQRRRPMAGCRAYCATGAAEHGRKQRGRPRRPRRPRQRQLQLLPWPRFPSCSGLASLRS